MERRGGGTSTHVKLGARESNRVGMGIGGRKRGGETGKERGRARHSRSWEVTWMAESTHRGGGGTLLDTHSWRATSSSISATVLNTSARCSSDSCRVGTGMMGHATTNGELTVECAGTQHAQRWRLCAQGHAACMQATACSGRGATARVMRRAGCAGGRDTLWAPRAHRIPHTTNTPCWRRQPTASAPPALLRSGCEA